MADAGPTCCWTDAVNIVQYHNMKRHDISISSLAYDMNPTNGTLHYNWISHAHVYACVTGLQHVQCTDSVIMPNILTNVKKYCLVLLRCDIFQGRSVFPGKSQWSVRFLFSVYMCAKQHNQLSRLSDRDVKPSWRIIWHCGPSRWNKQNKM